MAKTAFFKAIWKNITGPHASVHFQNGSNAKNAHENKKNVELVHMPFCISKMGQMPKTVEIAVLNKKFHNQNTS